MYDVPKGWRDVMDGIKVRILRNLKERVHPVNVNVALSGIDLKDGLEALNQLIKDGMVNESQLRPTHAAPLPMYQLSWKAQSLNTNLTLVK